MTAIPENSPARAVDAMPEAFVSHARISSEVSRRVADGRLRKLATRLYTRNLRDAPRDIVRRNLWAIVAGYFPDALVTDRTAFELAPAEDGSVCVVSQGGADIVLPGVVLRPRRGTPPQPDDQRFMNQRLFLSSPARAYLDNLCRSRARRGRLPRTLSRTDIEERLERLISSAGIDACNRLRDDAGRIAEAVDRAAQRIELDRIIGALAGTGDARLTAATAVARARGRAYDGARVALFEDLFAALRETHAPTRRPRPRDGIGNATLAFFEAYFSNYIEGTEFEVEEAAEIVFEGRIPPLRPADAHDILGVWRIVSDQSEMRRLPTTADELVDVLRSRHATAFEGRPELAPGRFKTVPNRVGAMTFVAPDAVLGTLEEGLRHLRRLGRAVPPGRVHPFSDLGSPSLCRRQRTARADHDERRTRLGQRGAYRCPDRVPGELHRGTARAFRWPFARAHVADAGLRVAMDGGNGLGIARSNHRTCARVQCLRHRGSGGAGGSTAQVAVNRWRPRAASV